MGELKSAVDALTAVPVTELETDALNEWVLELIGERDRLSGLIARGLAAQGQRTAWKTGGATSQKAWLADNARIGLPEAAAETQTARRLADLPQTLDAVTDGSITAAQARAAAHAVRDLPPDAVAGLDTLVVQHGPELDAGRLRAVVDDYAHRAAAESLEQREERAYRNRRLNLAKTSDGGGLLDGRLDALGAETVLTALASLAAPRDAGDSRTPEQRRADALVELCRRSLNAGDLPEVGSVRPHVTVVVPLETLQQRDSAPPAVLDRFGTVSGEAARLLACDASVTRVVTDGASQPLDVGRANRVVTVAQRKALAVRDGGCVGCRAPVAWCEAHHVQHWADGGPTDLANLVLVCWRCHRDIHHQGKHPARAPDGRWALRC